MYRIVCESYKNYIEDFSDNTNDFRYKVMQPFALLLDLNQYKYEKKEGTLRYKKLEDFIWIIKENINKYPDFKSLLWSLESRGINGRYYGVLNQEEFKEQIKIMRMFLRLSYWN